VENTCQAPQPWAISWLTAMFMHVSWDHLLGNMLFLAIFGKNVENAFGRLRYLAFYVAGGFAATVLQTAMTLGFSPDADARIPMLGASGAIGAVLGAFLALYPHARIKTLMLVHRPDPRLVLLGRVVRLPARRSALCARHSVGRRKRRRVLRAHRRVCVRVGRRPSPARHRAEANRVGSATVRAHPVLSV
jgi:Rhomboid family